MSPSRRLLSLLASCCFLFAAACGGTASEEAPTEAPEAPGVQALAVCSARCLYGPSISCSGTTCQASEYSYVSCDGRRTNCPSIPPPCGASIYCESLGATLSCSGTSPSCRQEGPQSSKVCGGVTCDGNTQWCPPLPGDLECY